MTELKTSIIQPSRGRVCTNLHHFVSNWLSVFWHRQEATKTLPRSLACTLEAVESISNDMCSMIKLFFCLMPLALARIIPNIVNQAVYRALTSDNDDVKALAGFGIAYNMYQLFECSIAAFSNVSQILIKSREDRRTVAMSTICIALIMIATCAMLSATDAGTWCFRYLFNVNDEVVQIAQKILGCICINILIQAISETHAGIIIQMRDTSAILLSSMLNLSAQMIVCLGISELTRDILNPLVLPIIAIYAGNSIRCLVILIWYCARVRGRLPDDSEVPASKQDTMAIFIPLACLALGRAINVPLARILMGYRLTTHEAVTENAIFSLVLAVERLFTSWLNRLKDVYLAYRSDKRVLTTDRTLAFTSSCLLVSVGFMSIFCAVSDIGDSYYHYVFRLDWHLSTMCRQSMVVFIFLPFFACLRAHAVYWLVKRKLTKPILPCVVLRLLALPVTDYLLSLLNVGGAKLAAGLCVACHGVEAVLVSIVALYYKHRTLKPERIPLLGSQ